MNYVATCIESQALGEGADCVIKAISIVTGKPYKEVHLAAQNCGRKSGRGVPEEVAFIILRVLGFDVHKIEFASKTAITIERELQKRHLGNHLIVSMTRHWAAFDGIKIDDWSRDSRKRVKAVYAVFPKALSEL